MGLVTVSKEMDIIFNSLFAGEMVLKIITYGLIIDEECYLRDNWNQLDCFIVCVSILDMGIIFVDI
jgi:uncharacterized protein YjhX (UPF0386 family)